MRYKQTNVDNDVSSRKSALPSVQTQATNQLLGKYKNNLLLINIAK